MRRVYLIDLENVQSAGLDGIDQLTEEDSIYIFYSDKADNLKIDLVRKIQDTPAKVDFIKAYNGTPNALDFQLISYLFFHLEEDAQYWIVSKDTGYDAAIKMSKRMGLSNVRRAPAIKNAVHFGQRAGRISAFRAARAAEEAQSAALSTSEQEMEEAQSEALSTSEQETEEAQSGALETAEEAANEAPAGEISKIAEDEIAADQEEVPDETENPFEEAVKADTETAKPEEQARGSQPEVITFFAAGTPYPETEMKTEQNSEEEPKTKAEEDSVEEEPKEKAEQNQPEGKPEADLTDPVQEEKDFQKEKAEEKPAGEKKSGKSGRQKRSRHTNHVNHPVKEDRKTSKKTGDKVTENAAPLVTKEKETAEKIEPLEKRESQDLKDDSAYREELQSILGKECNVATDPETIHMVEDGLRKSANKGQFYQFFRRRMGAARGSEFYKCVRGQFDTLKKLVAD